MNGEKGLKFVIIRGLKLAKSLKLGEKGSNTPIIPPHLCKRSVIKYSEAS